MLDSNTNKTAVVVLYNPIDFNNVKKYFRIK